MATHIEDPRLEEALRRLCELTGETVEEAVGKSIAQRLEAENSPKQSGLTDREARLEHFRQMQERIAKLPILDAPSPDEIIGYGEDGLPR